MHHEVATEDYIYDGSAYELTAWTVRRLDGFGRDEAVYYHDGTVHSNSWACCGKEWEIDREGGDVHYSYDNLRRLLTRQKGTTNLTESFTYDATGRQLKATRTGGGMSLVTSNAYDAAGRLILTVDPAGLATSNSYPSSTLGRPLTDETDEFVRKLAG